MYRIIFKSLTVLALTASIFAQNRERIGLGYDEGLALRFFITDRIGLQASIGFERLGGYDQKPNNEGALEPENNYSFGLAGIASIVHGEWVYLDAMLQLALAHDDTRSDEDIGDRNWFFVRCALAPEILLNDRLGLGMRLGLEVANMSDTKERAVGGGTQDSQDGVTNIRFYGPKNPFAGAVLGMAVYYYFGGNAY